MSLADLGQELQSAITNASSQLGVDAESLATLAKIESSGNSNINGGAFQLMPATALSLGVANVNDPQSSALGAGTYWQQVGNYLSTKLGSLQPWQNYVGYQQGPGGALALFNADPNSSAAQALIDAGVSPTQAFKSIGNNLPSGFNNGNPGSSTVGQFLGYWQDKWNKVSGGLGTSGTSSSTTPQGIASQTDSSWSGWTSHWIIRIFLFLLGLVFVAAGLFMLSKTGKLAISGVQVNAAGNIANRIASSPVRRYAVTEAPESPTPKIRIVNKTARKHSTLELGEGLGPLGRQRTAAHRHAFTAEMRRRNS